MQHQRLLVLATLLATGCGVTPLSPLAQQAGGGLLGALKAENGSVFAGNGIADAKSLRVLTTSSLPDEHPIWSPNGKQIAFQRPNGLDAQGIPTGFNLWLMNADGSGQRQLTFGDLDCQQPSWSPDGSKLAYRMATGKRMANGSREFDIALLDLARNRQSVLIKYPGDDKHPNFSHDGKWLVFNSERDGNPANVYLVSTADPGARPRRVTTNRDTNDVHPNFSPDGRQVLFHSYLLNAPPVADEPVTKLGIVDVDGSHQRWLEPAGLLAPKHPFFTADAGIITFHAHDAKTLRRNVYAMRLDGTRAVAITDVKNAKHPEVSPDGRFLAFALKRKPAGNPNGDAQYDIAVVAIDRARLKGLLK